MTNDELYMQRCIQLAKNGMTTTAPNPMVGAVIVHEGRIIGEGYHQRCGEGHAEVNALASVKDGDRHLLPQSTIYVSLEPCAHYGKTPPCADLIISQRLRRCVVGCVDPFAKVQGRGIEKLRQAGIEVTVGVLEAQCQWLNRRFFTFHQLHRPFITLKWAQTANGIIGTPPHILHVSNRLTQALCHKRRAEHQAILVGSRTYAIDKPQLNVRLWHGRQPMPVVLSHQRGPLVEQICQLTEQGVQTLLVEGGRVTLQSFIDQGLWDEAFVETSPSTIPPTPAAVYAPVLSNATRVDTQNLQHHRIDHYIHTT